MSFSSIKITLLQRFSLNFSANIIAAFWMLLGSVRAFHWVKPTALQFLAFLTTALFANILFAWLASDMTSEFNAQGAGQLFNLAHDYACGGDYSC